MLSGGLVLSGGLARLTILPMTAPSLAPGPRTQRPLRVALLGLGTVGREVARGLLRRDVHARATDGREVRLIAVADRDPSRLEGLDLAGVECLDDGSRLIGDADVDVVVELIGGVEGAGRLVSAALEAGHSVVTANKALLARRGAELEALARDREVALRFEAAVGGGVPVLSPLAADLAADRITSLRGILNGSTNYVLSAMASGDASYDDAIARAKALGYLEADPSWDVEGRDAADKIAILIRLAFGYWPDVTAIRRAPPAVGAAPGGAASGMVGADAHGPGVTAPDGPAGIAGVGPGLIAAARAHGFAVKLVASAGSRAPGTIAASVLPVAVPAGHPLAATDGPENRIEVVAEPIGSVAFVGPGAGGAPTSSAVIGDVLAIARGQGSTWAGLPEAASLPPDRLVDGLDVPRRWLALEPDGRAASLVGPASLTDVRRECASAPGTVLFPVLETP